MAKILSVNGKAIGFSGSGGRMSVIAVEGGQPPTPPTQYNITSTITNGSVSGPTSIQTGSTAQITITPNSGYELPETVTVTGATYNYNSSTGIINLSNPTSNVAISATCPEVAEVSYLCMTPESGSTATIGFALDGELQTTPVLHYSLDKSEQTEYTFGDDISLDNGQTCYWKGDNESFSEFVDEDDSQWENYIYFYSDNNVSVSGNIMTLLDSTGQSTAIPTAYCFAALFNEAPIISAPALLATELADHCYYYMFNNCRSLPTAPALPATTLAEYCYCYMFYNCTTLTTAPALPATTLVESCYTEMFSGCTSLTVAPELPATTLSDSCYYAMFGACTSLTTAPVLSATNLTDYCYEYMFYNCTSLTAAPELPATTLAFYCYDSMFEGCTSIDVQDTVNKLTAHIDFTSTTSPQGLQGIFGGLAITDEMLAAILPNYTLPATTLIDSCYEQMFYECAELTTPPALPATSLADSCYYGMFWGCSNIYISENSGPEGTYTEYRIPSVGTIEEESIGEDSLTDMFNGCGSGDIHTPEVNTIYYISRTVSISYAITNGDHDDVQKIAYGSEIQVEIQPDDGYKYPTEVTVTNAESSWDIDSGMLTISNPTGDVTVSATCESAQMFPLNVDVSNGTCNHPSSIYEDSLTILQLYPNTGYVLLEDNLSVTNAEYNFSYFNDITVRLDIYNPIGEVSINAQCTIWEPDYLCFTAEQANSTVAMSVTGTPTQGQAFEYSTDKTNWSTFTPGITAVALTNAGDKVYFKGDNQTVSEGQSDYYKFVMTGRISASGDIMSLIDNSGPLIDIPHGGCFCYMFGDCASLTSAPKLPATNLADECYYGMFSGCTSLTIAPTLPAKALEHMCYDSMFEGCTSLTTAPALPAKTLANYCYYRMFEDCTSLTTSPMLPATTLAEECYDRMFYGCTSLTTAPALPATTLARECYAYMFQYCAALTTAPALPATILANSCYAGMFESCTSLTTAPDLPATSLETSCCASMFENCTSLTTAPELPATTLDESCYYGMFEGCTSLTTAPTLPAETLADSCYESMFEDCTSLTIAPALPAITLAEYCYDRMFYGCTSLTTAPELPATTLAFNCYYLMFYGCTSINVQDTVNKLTSHIDFTSTTSPQGLQGIFAGLAITDEMLASVLPNYSLPATTLEDNCYDRMFSDCTALTTAPSLPATIMTRECYSFMFEGCTSLTTVPALPSNALADYCYENMFYGCTSLQIQDSSGEGHDKAWTIPTSGTYIDTYEQEDMFYHCSGIRASDTMPGEAGYSYTYYTQNTPV